MTDNKNIEITKILENTKVGITKLKNFKWHIIKKNQRTENTAGEGGE